MPNITSQQLAQQHAAAAALQAQTLNFDNLEMTHAIAAALQQQQQLPTDVNVLQYLTAIDQMQAAGVKVPTAASQAAVVSGVNASTERIVKCVIEKC